MEYFETRGGERWFGRIVVHTVFEEVFSLDLFETPDLVCRGFYIPPTGRRFERMEEFIENPTPPVAEIELTATVEAIGELERTSTIRRDRSEAPGGDLSFGVYRPGLDLDGTLTLVSERVEEGPPDRHQEVWTGSVGRGEMAFVLERHGSPEIVVLIALIFLLIFEQRQADTLDEACLRRAVEMCGEGRIKSYKARRNMTGLADPLGFGHDCEIECR